MTGDPDTALALRIQKSNGDIPSPSKVFEAFLRGQSQDRLTIPFFPVSRGRN